MDNSEGLWKIMKNHLQYSDEDMEMFRNNPRNMKILEKAPDFMNKTILFEVVESIGCNSQHKPGDRIYLDGAGNVLSGKGPEKICIFALHAMTALVYGAQELIYADVDPNKLCFNRVGCHDVGVRCGGWGHIVMEIRVVDKDSL